MRKNFKSSLLHILAHEGGYVDHPNDPGGATNRGITLKVFRQHYGRHLGKEDLRQISEREAGAIYKASYWDKCQCDRLPAGVDYSVFDQAVNSGPGRSVRWLQTVAGAAVDGSIGPKTLAAVADADPPVVVDRMCDTRLKFLKALPHWEDFGRGWQSRVKSVRGEAQRLAGGGKPIAAPASAASYEIVKRGSAGPWVKKLQKALNQFRGGEPALKADGKFGRGTKRALVRFQKLSGLDADGVAGYNTYQALGLIS